MLALPDGVVAEDGETSPVARPSPSGGLMLQTSPAQYLPGWLQIGGQIRGRFENTSGSSLLDDRSDAYYLSRIRERRSA